MNEQEALIVLVNTQGLGPVKIRLLIERFGSATSTLQATAEEIQELPGFGERLVRHVIEWENNSNWKKDLELIDSTGTELIPYTDPRYPSALLKCSDHPILLYMKGTLLPEDAQGIAVVGTRQATIYGREMAEEISSDLARQRYTVVSGLARGVDTAAHNGALKTGRTIAVLGSGLANIYPKENSQLADHISQQGAVLSEFPMATPPDRQHFPQRNRIVSGMTRGSLLIEAPAHSGAMITMNKAWEQEKTLFALPGRADLETFRGNHKLIKSGKAALVENANDIMEAFSDLFGAQQTSAKPKPVIPPLDTEEKELLSLLPSEEQNIDALIRLTGWPVAKLNIMLMSLVIKKVVKEFPGKIYKRA